MRAAIYKGDRAIEVERVERPAPATGEVEIRVAYAGICGTDLHAYHGAMDARIGHARVLGHEVSGTVSRLGEGATGFAEGEAVVVRPLLACGACPACAAGHAHVCHKLTFLGLDSDGGFRDFWSVPAAVLHKVPAGATLRHAALVEPLAVACHDVRRARLVAGEDTLVVGGGPIGLLIAIVARRKGANVMICEPNPTRREMCEGFGFATLDPAAGDLGAAVAARTDQKGVEVAFEVSGAAAAVRTITDAVATRGRIVMVAIHTEPRPVDLFRFFWRELEMIGARVYEPQDFDEALALLAEGAVDADRFVTDVRPLEEIAAAFAAADGAVQSMKTLIDVNGETA